MSTIKKLSLSGAAAAAVAALVGAALHLHDAPAAHALRQILVGHPANVRLEFDHRPHGDAHGRERVLERARLRGAAQRYAFTHPDQ